MEETYLDENDIEQTRIVPLPKPKPKPVCRCGKRGVTCIEHARRDGVPTYLKKRIDYDEYEDNLEDIKNKN